MTTNTAAAARHAQGLPVKQPPAATREEMIEAYLPLVRMVAERIHRRLPPGIDLSSLVHSGIVGLLEALQRYDARRGVAFHTYARYRIQGEIMEYLRSLDWVSRSVRAWGRRVTAARVRLASRFGREPTPEEMAEALGVSLEEFFRVDRKVNDAVLLRLEDLSLVSEEDWQRARESFLQHPFHDPLASVESKDLVDKLAAAVETLSERERLVVTLYYHEELTLREIGEILGLTEGRICQIHARAIVHLRQALEGHGQRSGGEGEMHQAEQQTPSPPQRASLRGVETPTKRKRGRFLVV